LEDRAAGRPVPEQNANRIADRATPEERPTWIIRRLVAYAATFVSLVWASCYRAISAHNIQPRYDMERMSAIHS
jgi:hypothetical protein